MAVNTPTPPFLDYPAQELRNSLTSVEWQECLQIWIKSVEIRLGIADEQYFEQTVEERGIVFLLSYLSDLSPHIHDQKLGSHSIHLRKLCFALIKKNIRCPEELLPSGLFFDLLSSGSLAYGQVEAWKTYLATLWTLKQKRITKSLETAKSELSLMKTAPLQVSWLRKISALTKALPMVATITVAGADYIDTLTELFTTGNVETKRAITENVFYSYVSLIQTKHLVVLTDNIYHMLSESGRLSKHHPDQQTILSSLLCSTSFLRHFSSNDEIASRKEALVGQLQDYRQTTSHLHPKHAKSKVRKGKARQSHDESMHMHKAAQISQIQDLFPDLDVAYILQILDHYSDNVENAIAALLEPNNLPEILRHQNIINNQQFQRHIASDLEPRSTPLSVSSLKKNVIENDDFDNLQIPVQKLRRGKKDISDTLNSPDDHARSKAAILAALASFDADDDERDDTYDVADVGGAVDNTVDTDSRSSGVPEETESSLFNIWKENPEIFARDSKTRASNLRRELKSKVGLSDEQLEGWAIMLNRDKKLQDRLQDKFSTVRSFSGRQNVIESTKWQANTSADNSEVDSGPERSNDARRMGQAGIRGHRTFARGRGGSTSGPSDDAATQQARKRKEQGRARGGSSNRKDAHAKKATRAMGPLPTA